MDTNILNIKCVSLWSTLCKPCQCRSKYYSFHESTHISSLSGFGISKALLDEAFFFFPIWVFFHEHSRITGPQGKEEGIYLTPHYHFHPLHRQLDIRRAITAESSPLPLASSQTRTKNLWFPSTSCWPLSYVSHDRSLTDQTS